MSSLGLERQHPDMEAVSQGRLKYTPAYDALLPYVRRVSVEDDVSLLTPGEYLADSSELIQMLRKGHQGIQLDTESWDRLITWIDLNAPCHGTWNDVFPVPEKSDQRRSELRQEYGGPYEDPEAVPDNPQPEIRPLARQLRDQAHKETDVVGYPFGWEQVKRIQAAFGEAGKQIDLGQDIVLELVRVPAGSFVMGDPGGQPDEYPAAKVVIDNPY